MFPDRRVVALYGTDLARVLGVLGEQSPEASVERLQGIMAPYRAGDRPVQGAFELIATIATAAAGIDGLYRSQSSDAHVQRYIDAARSAGLIVILDLQPGRSDFLTEARRYDAFLRQPDVHLALDPEWRVGPDERPGGGLVGSVDAAEVNAVADYLAALVAEEQLPDKMLVVHQFQSRMIGNRERLVEPDGVTLTIHMDGFGTRTQKLDTYRAVQATDPFDNGFKLFFDEDIDMFEANDVLAIDPSPDLITYQ